MVHRVTRPTRFVVVGDEFGSPSLSRRRPCWSAVRDVLQNRPPLTGSPGDDRQELGERIIPS
jgi:hypothetical protein